jgi:hypothetical protein
MMYVSANEKAVSLNLHCYDEDGGGGWWHTPEAPQPPSRVTRLGGALHVESS